MYIINFTQYPLSAFEWKLASTIFRDPFHNLSSKFLASLIFNSLSLRGNVYTGFDIIA